MLCKFINFTRCTFDTKKLILLMEHYIINLVGSAIAQTKFPETQWFLQNNLHVQWKFKSGCSSAQSDHSSLYTLKDILRLRTNISDFIGCEMLQNYAFPDKMDLFITAFQRLSFYEATLIVLLDSGILYFVINCWQTKLYRNYFLYLIQRSWFFFHIP